MDIIEAAETFFGTIADFLWEEWMLVLLLDLGIYYTMMTNFVQFRYFPYVCKQFLKGSALDVGRRHSRYAYQIRGDHPGRPLPRTG